jgi:hypothetical protein
MSLISSTDVSDRADILIFVSSDLYEETVDCLNGIIGKDCFVRVESSQKYLIHTHPSTQKYDNFLMLDTDSFFLGRDTIFEKMEKFYANPENSKTMFMVKDFIDSKTAFWTRKSSHCEAPSLERYESFYKKSIGEEEFEKMMKKNWWVSYAVAYSKEHFKEEGYSSYAAENFQMGQGCDETVFLTWAHKNSYDLRGIEKFFPCYDQYISSGESVSDFFTEQNIAALYHPLVGENALNICNVFLLAEIEKKHEALLEH